MQQQELFPTQSPTHVTIETDGVPIKAWTTGVPFEPEAQSQLQKVAQLPFIYKWLSIMPDVHAGIGSTIGSVIATKGAIIPAAVGVDIGCGLYSVRTNLTADSICFADLQVLRQVIEKAVPHGRTDNGGKNDRGAWSRIPDDVMSVWNTELKEDFISIILKKYPKLAKSNCSNHLGTLGTGNHFVEVCLDEENRVWFMLHSGSRGIGNSIGSLFIELAKKDMKQWMIELPDSNLAYFPKDTEHFNDYWKAVSWAQKFASLNREIMMKNVVAAVSKHLLKEIELDIQVNCHHNYVAIEHHYGEDVYITRKGAIRAREGELGIIPGSMGTKSFIVSGKGNKESFCSSSHGAGRKMSRTAAKKTFTVEQHIEATKGIECRKDVSVIDETPGAYKSIDDVMNAQKELVDIVHTLRQIVCVKG
jgi:tRNA-splicing ligase RtcB